MNAASPLLSPHESRKLTRTISSRRSRLAGGPAEMRRRNSVLDDQLAALRRENDDLHRTLLEAAHTQRKLCGPRHLRRGPIEIASEIFPVRHLSGDFISIFDFEEDLIFAIGDIAGKGLYAAMWFTHLISMVQSQFAACGDPASTLVAMNQDLLRTNLEIPLTTLLLVRVDTAAGEITYCSAGHPPAFLLRLDARPETLSEGGPILGALPSASFANGKAAMLPGDTLVGYSDGAVECNNCFGTEFGSGGLLAAAQNSCGSAASATLFSILGAIEDFTGSQPRADDIALIVAHRTTQ